MEDDSKDSPLRKLQTLSRDLYSNCKLLSPDGVLMCRTGKRRVEWYLNKGLAEIVDENPLTIKLNFQPNGLGKSKDKFYLVEKKNICVVCGSDEQLTRHHCVPACFRRNFPINMKKNSSHDIVALCARCHSKYEQFADLEKKKIPSVRYNMATEEDVLKGKAVSYANALIPTPEVIGEVSKERWYSSVNTQSYTDYVNGLENIPDFITWWRKHFVKTMKPKYLPKYWSTTGRYVCNN